MTATVPAEEPVVETLKESNPEPEELIENKENVSDVVEECKAEEPTKDDTVDSLESSVVVDDDDTNLEELVEAAPLSTDENTKEESSSLPLKKPMTAYFHFLSQYRPILKQEFPDLRLGPLQKKLSEKWKTLTDDEKLVFTTLAADQKTAYEAKKAALISSGKYVEKQQTTAVASTTIDETALAFPFARVKKFIMNDPDVKKISKEAVFSIGKAAELFLEFVGKRASINASLSKRKTINHEDVRRTVHLTPVLDFLRKDFEKPAAKKTATTVPRKRASAESSASAAQPKNTIASFFKKQKNNMTT